MKRSNGICKICNNLNETTCHLLYGCPVIRQLWQLIATRIQEKLKLNLALEIDTILFGAYKCEDKKQKQFYNLVIFETKWQIWKKNEIM